MGRYTLHQKGTLPRHRKRLTRIRRLRRRVTHTHRHHNLVVIKDILIKDILRLPLRHKFTIMIITTTIVMMILVVPPFYEAGKHTFHVPRLDVYVLLCAVIV